LDYFLLAKASNKPISLTTRLAVNPNLSNYCTQVVDLATEVVDSRLQAVQDKVSWEALAEL